MIHTTSCLTLSHSIIYTATDSLYIYTAFLDRFLSLSTLPLHCSVASYTILSLTCSSFYYYCCLISLSLSGFGATWVVVWFTPDSVLNTLTNSSTPTSLRRSCMPTNQSVKPRPDLTPRAPCLCLKNMPPLCTLTTEELNFKALPGAVQVWCRQFLHKLCPRTGKPLPLCASPLTLSHPCFLPMLSLTKPTKTTGSSIPPVIGIQPTLTTSKNPDTSPWKSLPQLRRLCRCPTTLRATSQRPSTESCYLKRGPSWVVITTSTSHSHTTLAVVPRTSLNPRTCTCIPCIIPGLQTPYLSFPSRLTNPYWSRP